MHNAEKFSLKEIKYLEMQYFGENKVYFTMIWVGFDSGSGTISSKVLGTPTHLSCQALRFFFNPNLGRERDCFLMERCKYQQCPQNAETEG